MFISDFVKGLLPSLSQDTVVEDARITIGELRDTVIPAYELAVRTLKGYKFKSANVQEKFSLFSKNVGGSRNTIESINDGLSDIVKNLDGLTDLVRRSTSSDIARDGLTYKKANILQFLNYAAFVSRYARKFLNYVYVLESAELKDSDVTLADSLTKPEIDWLEANFISFCQAYGVVTMHPDKVRSSLDSIPEVQVTGENEQTLGASIGFSKIDPFAMRFIPAWINPFYRIRMGIAEYQVKRHRASIEEMRLLQLRVIHLKKLIDNKPDPKLSKEIKIIEGEIEDLNFKIHKFETEHA